MAYDLEPGNIFPAESKRSADRRTSLTADSVGLNRDNFRAAFEASHKGSTQTGLPELDLFDSEEGAGPEAQKKEAPPNNEQPFDQPSFPPNKKDTIQKIVEVAVKTVGDTINRFENGERAKIAREVAKGSNAKAGGTVQSKHPQNDD